MDELLLRVVPRTDTPNELQNILREYGCNHESAPGIPSALMLPAYFEQVAEAMRDHLPDKTSCCNHATWI